MRNGISITVSRSDRRRLQALVADRNASQKHVWRAEIVLLTADGLGTNEIMRRTAKSKTCVWRWQERFMEEGFEGLLRDKTRPSRIEPLKADVAERVVAMTLTDPPGEGKRSHEALKSVANAMRLYALKRPALIASIHRGNVVGLSRETSRSRSAVKTECAEQSGRRLPIRCADWFPYALVVDPVVDPELRLNARGGNSRHHVGLVDSRRNTSRRL